MQFTREEFIEFIKSLPEQKKAFESDYGCAMSDEQAVDWARMLVDCDGRIEKYFIDHLNISDATYWIAESIWEGQSYYDNIIKGVQNG